MDDITSDLSDITGDSDIDIEIDIDPDTSEPIIVEPDPVDPLPADPDPYVPAEFFVYGDSEPSDVAHYNELHSEFNQTWSELGSSVSSVDRLFEVFSSSVSNSLCIAVSSAVLVVFGFHFFSRLISSFRG